MTSQAHTFPRAWDHSSGVDDCDACEGQGRTSHGGMGGNDPDTYTLECPECDGRGFHACSVCGFDVQTSGFDCLVCSLAAELTPAQMNDINPADLADSFAAAVNAALNGRVA